jgi:hypothetical protein
MKNRHLLLKLTLTLILQTISIFPIEAPDEHDITITEQMLPIINAQQFQKWYSGKKSPNALDELFNASYTALQETFGVTFSKKQQKTWLPIAIKKAHLIVQQACSHWLSISNDTEIPHHPLLNEKAKKELTYAAKNDILPNIKDFMPPALHTVLKKNTLPSMLIKTINLIESLKKTVHSTNRAINDAYNKLITRTYDMHSTFEAFATAEHFDYVRKSIADILETDLQNYLSDADEEVLHTFALIDAFDQLEAIIIEAVVITHIAHYHQ